MLGRLTSEYLQARSHGRDKSAIQLRHVLPSVCISTAHTGWIAVKFDIGKFGGKLSGKIQIWLKSIKIIGWLYTKTYLCFIMRFGKIAESDY